MSLNFRLSALTRPKLTKSLNFRLSALTRPELTNNVDEYLPTTSFHYFIVKLKNIAIVIPGIMTVFLWVIGNDFII